MSRRRKNKEMSEKKFKNKVCNRCKSCSGIIIPAFCFNKLYKSDPPKFIRVMPSSYLNNQVSFELLRSYNYKDMMVRVTTFRRIFCQSNICKNCKGDVATTMNCITIFRNQSDAKAKSTSVIKKVKHHVKIIKKPEVTIMCSDDDEFKEEVKRIIENNNKQQD